LRIQIESTKQKPKTAIGELTGDAVDSPAIRQNILRSTEKSPPRTGRDADLRASGTLAQPPRQSSNQSQIHRLPTQMKP
jgi:hypothetical protein